MQPDNLTTENVSTVLNFNVQLSEILVRIFYHLSFYFTGIFILPAIIFNILILYVMIASGTGTTETTRMYYSVMAYGELGTVIFKDVIRYWLGVGWPSITKIDPLGDLNLHRNGTNWQIVCPIEYFFSYSHELMANGAMVLFGIERVCALYSPFHVHSIFSYKRTIGILCILLISVLLFCSTIFQFVDLRHYKKLPIKTLCVFSREEGVWSWFGKILLVCNFCVPALLSIVCSALITAKLVRRKHAQSTFRHYSSSSASTASLIDQTLRGVATATLAPALSSSAIENNLDQSNNFVQTHNFAQSTRNEISVCITLLLISCLHVLFYFPLAVLRITYLILPSFRTTSRNVALEVLLLFNVRLKIQYQRVSYKKDRNSYLKKRSDMFSRVVAAFQKLEVVSIARKASEKLTVGSALLGVW